MGDLNRQNPFWGSSIINQKGKMIEDFTSDNDLCIFSDESDTYLHPASGTYSSVDLFLTDSDLFTWVSPRWP